MGQLVAAIGMAVLDYPVHPICILSVVVGVILAIHIMLFEEKRWQQCDLVTKFVRICFFTPRRWLQFNWWLLKWAFKGCRPLKYECDGDGFAGLELDRLQTLNHFYTISRSMADYDMQHWFTIEECRAKLKARKDEANTQAAPD